MTHRDQLTALRAWMLMEWDWLRYERDQARKRLRIERRVRQLERNGNL